MKTQFNLNVTKPCIQNFETFKPTANGGFCTSCTKEVIDFTKMNTAEISNYFKINGTKNTCGKFKAQQLHTEIPIRQNQRRLRLASGFAIACLSLFSFGTLHAQNTKSKAETKKTILTNDILVKGNVSESGLAIPGVNILLQGTKVGTQTDFDGNFIFPKKLKIGDVLLFSYIGYKSEKVVITEKSNSVNIDFKLNMELDPVIIMGEVSAKRVFKSH